MTENDTKPKVYFVTNIAPLYRANLFKKLANNKFFDITFFFGLGSNGITGIDLNKEEFKEFASQSSEVKNYWFKNKVLIWQTDVVLKSIFSKPNLVILLGEFSILSNWFSAFIFRIRSIPVIMYGHGMYGNETGLKLFLRRSYLKLAKGHLLYEKHAKKVLTQQGFDNKKLYVFHNSLDYDLQKETRDELIKSNNEKPYTFFENSSLPTIIFIGRLTPEKKLINLILLSKRLMEIGIPINLLIIGKGSERESLELEAEKLLKNQTYHFYGACYDETILGSLIYNADLCVSPGNVGLTAIHSLSYGTPVTTHSNFYQQGPEVESIEEGKTGFLFEQDNLDDLVKKTALWLNTNLEDRDEIRKKCYKIIDDFYNPYKQMEIFTQMANDFISTYQL
jgi:glycosyltransferase involved in cell wall biosynthesis